MIVKLTQTLVDSYSLPENSTKQLELVHVGRSGLYLLISNTGNKVFYARYRQGGSKRSEGIHYFPGLFLRHIHEAIRRN